MAPETVTVGDTDVEIRETDDGFEAVPVEDEPEGPYLAAQSTSYGGHGFLLPLDADLAIEPCGAPSGRLLAAWSGDDDLDDELSKRGRTKAKRRLAEGTDFDRYAAIDEPYVVSDPSEVDW